MLGIGLLLVAGSLLAHLGRRYGLPSVSGYLVAGLGLGTVPALFPADGTGTASLLLLAATGYAVFVVGVAVSRARADLRVLACLVPCCLVVGAGALVLALELLPRLWPALPALEGRTQLVVALVLMAASPTLVACVVEEHVQGPAARAAITVALAFDGVVLLLVAGLVAAPTAGAASGLEMRLPTFLELDACVGVGVIAGALLVQRRVSTVAFASCLGIGVLVLERLASLAIAVVTMCLLAGLAYRERWPARAGTLPAAALHLALMTCFGLAATTVDVRQVLDALAPAVVLVMVRAAALSLGGRLAARLDRRAGAGPLGAAPLLPQAGLALLLLDTVPALDGAWRSLVVAVVLVDALVMPAWLRARFAAAHPAELLGLGADAGALAQHREEPGAHVAAEERGVLAVEHEAAHAQPQHVGRAVGGEQDLRRAAGGGVGAERGGDAGPLHRLPRIGEERRVQQELAGRVANLEVESHHVLLGQYCMRNGDLGAVDGAQDDDARAHGRQAALDLAHPQVVAQPIAVLDPEHHRVEQVAQPGQPGDRDEPHRDRAGQAVHPLIGDQPT